jgi:hypothetical protein
VTRSLQQNRLGGVVFCSEAQQNSFERGGGALLCSTLQCTGTLPQSWQHELVFKQDNGNDATLNKSQGNWILEVPGWNGTSQCSGCAGVRLIHVLVLRSHLCFNLFNHCQSACVTIGHVNLWKGHCGHFLAQQPAVTHRIPPTAVSLSSQSAGVREQAVSQSKSSK